LNAVTEDLVVNLNAGPGPEVTNASGSNTLDWDENIIHGVGTGIGDDLISDNAFGNVLSGGLADADTIFGREGNDQIDVLDGSPDDTVDCGENLIGDTDSEVVLYDPGDDIDLTN
jgi:hypothetical protein